MSKESTYVCPFREQYDDATSHPVPGHCEERECNGKHHATPVVPPRRLRRVQVAREALTLQDVVQLVDVGVHNGVEVLLAKLTCRRRDEKVRQI